MLLKAVEAFLVDEAFSLDTISAKSALKIAYKVKDWILHNEQAASSFETRIVSVLDGCFASKGKCLKKKRERMWSSYHQLRVSDKYMEEWKNFLKKSDSGCNPTFYQ